MFFITLPSQHAKAGTILCLTMPEYTFLVWDVEPWDLLDPELVSGSVFRIQDTDPICKNVSIETFQQEEFIHD